MKLSKWFCREQGENLEENFKSPPKEFSLLPFWAWNDSLKSDKICHQIDEMLDKGVYGAFMHARAGIEDCDTPYFSEGWWEAVKTAIEYGKEKGFFAILYDEDKWPSGSAGGRVVASNPESFSKKGLNVDKWEITGPRNIQFLFFHF